MKLVWASPTYGPVEPEAQRSQRNAIMSAANNGITWVGDASPDKEKYDTARNHVVKDVFKNSPDADGVFWCDSDIILPPNAVSLASQGLDFVTGIYFQKREPYWPLCGRFNYKKDAKTPRAVEWMSHWPEDVLAPVDGCGFGCVFTSMKLLRAISAPHFEYNAEWSEDLYFCVKAKEAGFQLWVDTRIMCGHLPPPAAIGFENFRAYRDRVMQNVVTADESKGA